MVSYAGLMLTFQFSPVANKTYWHADIFNCRCTLIASIKGFERDVSDIGQRNSKLGSMSYDDWKAGHYEQRSDDLLKQEEIAETMQWIYGAEYRKYGSLDDDIPQVIAPEGFIDKIKNILAKHQNDGNMNLEEIMQGKPMSIKEALSGTNPNYGQPGYDSNCQKCVQVYEYRRRGFDVEALPLMTRQDRIQWGNECFIDENGRTPEYTFDLYKEDLVNEIFGSPDGSRFAIYTRWADSPLAHVFVAEKQKGKIIYVDPQSNSGDVSDYLERGRDGSFGLLRMDDKKLTSNVNVLESTMKGRK